MVKWIKDKVKEISQLFESRNTVTKLFCAKCGKHRGFNIFPITHDKIGRMVTQRETEWSLICKECKYVITKIKLKDERSFTEY